MSAPDGRLVGADEGGELGNGDGGVELEVGANLLPALLLPDVRQEDLELQPVCVLEI